MTQHESSSFAVAHSRGGHWAASKVWESQKSMVNLATALKDEIRRVARKEIKAQTASMSQAVSAYRREIARLKRLVRGHERKLSFLEGQERKRLTQPEHPEKNIEGVRFSARSVKAQRQKIGMSAADYGKLVGVSALTIYNWEQGKTRPRKEQLSALVALRGIGKREARNKLKLVAGNGEGFDSRNAQARRKK